MLNKDLPLRTKLVLYILIGTIIVLITSSAITINTVTAQEKELAYSQSIEMAENYATKFDRDMNSNMAIADTLARTLEEYESGNRTEINDILKKLLNQNPHLIGTYVAFEPDAFDGRDEQYIDYDRAHDETGRFIPYWNKISGDTKVEALLDYEIEDYYQLPKNKKQNILTEPYIYQGELIVSFVSPVMENNTFRGIGGVDVSLNYIDEEVSNIRTFKTGYAFTTSNDGIFLSHPQHKEWIGSKRLTDLDIPEVGKAVEDVKNGKEGYIETIDPTTKREVIMFYSPVETGNFSFVLIVPEEEMFAGVTALKNRLIQISFIAIIFMGILAFIIARSISYPIDNIVDDFKTIANEAVEGNMNVRAGENINPDFKAIPVGLNEILDKLQEANAQNEELQNIINSSPTIAFRWEANNTWPVLFVSKNVSRLGYTPEELLSGKLDYGDIIHPDDLKVVQNRLQEQIDRKVDDFTTEYRILTGSGDVRWVDERTLIRYDENMEVKYLKGIVVDVTQRKLTQEALIEAKLEAEDANRTKSQFLASMSHELRTPLNSIIGFADIMLEQIHDKLNERQYKYVRNISDSGRYLLSLINNILDLSKIESGRMELSTEKFHPEDVIKEVRYNTQSLASRKNIELNTSIDPDITTIDADRIKFKQILYNLVSNAIKFTPENGQITIKAKIIDNMINLEVIDSGIGITEEDISRLFQPFSQIESQKQQEGTGLGLVLVKRFIEMHHGNIYVNSEVGKGTTFGFNIPIKQKE